MKPILAFQRHRASAKKRGIPFEMTFDEWWAIWKDWFHLRGRGKNALCMARNGDTGPYAVGNVYLTTNLGNLLEAAARREKSDDERIARQHKRQMLRGKRCGNREFKSHVAFKAHCDPEKFVAE